jgi:hypothetical protein
VGVGGYPVMLLASFLERFHVYDGRVEVAQVVEELVVDLAGYGVRLLNRQLRVYRHVDLRA